MAAAGIEPASTRVTGEVSVVYATGQMDAYTRSSSEDPMHQSISPHLAMDSYSRECGGSNVCEEYAASRQPSDRED